MVNTVTRMLFISMERPAIVSPASKAVRLTTESWLGTPIQRRSWVGVCVFASVSARACVRDVFAIYDNDIFPRLITIVIKIIILYFIQIRHTDDFS